MAAVSADIKKRRPARGGAIRKAAPVARPDSGSRRQGRIALLMSAPISTGAWVVFSSLLAVAFLNALAVVYSSHESRMRLHALQQLEQQRNALQVEWGRLLLEQSSLVSQGRLETRAMTELGMSVPDETNVVIIRTP